MAKRERRRIWYEDPKIAGDTAYWKPKSEVWVWLAIASFAVVLLVNWLVPARQPVSTSPYRVVIGALILSLVVAYFAALGNPVFRKKLYHKAQFLFACGSALTLWDLLTSKSALLPLPYFPSVVEIINVMFQDRLLLLRSTFYSMRLFFAGLVTGTVLGLATGIFIGWYRQWDYWLSPVIRVTGIVPAVAWLPVALLVFPNSFTTGMFLIFISSWFPVSSMMAAGIIATRKSYFEAA
ncbi:MAG: ABC transporter permease, partial [Treponema sp.]|nr:ABC transporter permease [Treponema sp.]